MKSIIKGNTAAIHALLDLWEESGEYQDLMKIMRWAAKRGRFPLAADGEWGWSSNLYGNPDPQTMLPNELNERLYPNSAIVYRYTKECILRTVYRDMEGAFEALQIALEELLKEME